MLKVACVAVVKNEQRRIAEWIAYQFAIGFQKVLLLDNLSTDETKARALALAATHDVEVLDWPVASRTYQTAAYEFAMAHLERQYDWIAFFDADEYLVLTEGHDLQSCLGNRPNSAALVVSWAMFGSSGHRAAPAGPVVETFLYRSDASFGPNAHVKSIVRTNSFIACRNGHVFDVDGPTTDLAGRTLSWQIQGVHAGLPDYSIGKLHHYFTRSFEEWLDKLRRGYNCELERRIAEFEAYDRNEVFDDSAARRFRAGSPGAPALPAGAWRPGLS